VASMKQSSILQGVAQKGSVLQVVSTTKTDTFSTTSTSFTALTGLSVSITPTATTSKILASVFLSYGANNEFTRGKFQLLRDSTAVGIGDAEGVRLRAMGSMFTGSGSNARMSDEQGSASSQFLDSPATTSATTYSVSVAASAGTLFINTSSNNSNTTNPSNARLVSTITLMEVAG